ncbi:hypothetical protein HELRODRAFT_185582 [Helobdella robusta]|uniref:Cytochrome c oxidase subunit 7C, mitochondrial n=1 Tax=Helobdella robusta TaxID=6412 RepID=T1FN03_HELRO|nr:hypothetical protein HELRODRAFT_185582 [Helobdella robusta]ESO04779.1 hypothetical protein HELRODRAFT_185582 [Helobdella robusta]
MLFSRLGLLRTRGTMSVVRQFHIDQQGRPGANLPFDIHNRKKLLALMIVFFGSGFGAPFFLLRHQLLKD